MEGNRKIVLGLMLLCSWGVVGGWAEYCKYKDPKQPLNVRINDLHRRMTLEEKIGQMAQIERSVASSQVMKEHFVGSVLSGPTLLSIEESARMAKATPKEWIEMVNEIQKAALATRLGIPMIYGIDAIHGHGNVYRATIFPHNIGLGATRDPHLAKRIGAATALEVRATGIPYAFAPSVSVCRDPRWGRCYESYGEDPKLVENMTSIISGLQGRIPIGAPKGVPYVSGTNKVAACAKHYVGDGGTHLGINENDTMISFRGLLRIHMAPYYPSIAQGVSTIMVSYSSWNGVKMHSNRNLITYFLKNILGFRGFVISDWEGVDRITSPPGENYTLSLESGLRAGIDMFMIPFNLTQYILTFRSLVEGNHIPMSRVDDAVKRILRVKFTMGLFEHPMADETFVDHLGSKEHRELAREAVRKSMVLLKNGKDAYEPFLPLPKKTRKILVAGSHAHNLGYQCGGWTIAWKGISGNENVTQGTTILQAINSTVDESTNVKFTEAPTSEEVERGNYSYGIVVVGEMPYAETDGDNLNNLTLPDPAPDTIKNVCSHIKCVVIVVSGRPVVFEPYLSMVDALVAAWLPGTEGQGVADVLFGDYGFSGKLPRTWFKSVSQLPMNVGDPNYDPLFSYGFGLTTEGKMMA